MVRIDLQVIFASDLLWHNSRKFKDFFCSGKKDKFSSSRCNWSEVAPNHNKAQSQWKIFLSCIVTNCKILRSVMKRDTHLSCHTETIVCTEET